MKKKTIRTLLSNFLIFSMITIPFNFILIIQDLHVNFLDENSIVNKIRTQHLNIANTWATNGREICNEKGSQLYPQICSDGTGGAIITWKDERINALGDIYAQKVDSTGNIIWTLNGLEICTENNIQGAPQICSDDESGAIITWNDKRNGLDYDIYAQKINSSGITKWNVNGSEICTAEEDQAVPQICSDGAGGAIIVWNDFRNGANYDIYVQRINSTGNIKWAVNGTEICIVGGDQTFPQICSDGNGGAIITWEDSRGLDMDIYAQRINSTGFVQWDINGVPICTESNIQWYPQISSDGNGGAIITWEDSRGPDADIYAQRINSTGFVQWDINGTEICSAGKDQVEPVLCSDGIGGVIITWKDMRNSSFFNVYAQKINLIGDIQWTIDGNVICAADGTQEELQICSDGAEGAIVTWEDDRDLWTDIYAQRINSKGNVIWNTNGIIICNENYNQNHPQICENGNGGVIITWDDFRNGSNYDIYAYLIKTPSKERDGGMILIIHILIISGIAAVVIITSFLLNKYRKIKE